MPLTQAADRLMHTLPRERRWSGTYTVGGPHRPPQQAPPQRQPLREPHRPDPLGIRAHYPLSRGGLHRHRAGRLHVDGDSRTDALGHTSYHRHRYTLPYARPGRGRPRHIGRQRPRQAQLCRSPYPRYIDGPARTPGLRVHSRRRRRRRSVRVRDKREGKFFQKFGRGRPSQEQV